MNGQVLPRALPNAPLADTAALIGDNKEINKTNMAMFAVLRLVDSDIEIHGELLERTIDQVRAVIASTADGAAGNAHDELVAAAQAFLKYFGSDDPEANVLAMCEDYSTATEVQEKCRSALAKAGAANKLPRSSAKPEATVDQLKTGISRCVDAALNQHPLNLIGSGTTEERAKTFASTLSGWLEAMPEQELADKVFSIFKRSEI